VNGLSKPFTKARGALLLGTAGISSITGGNNSDIRITNTGDLSTTGFTTIGIYGILIGRRSDLEITNSGTINTAGLNADGFFGVTTGRNSDIKVTNDGDINTLGIDAEGMTLLTYGPSSSIAADNSAAINTLGAYAEGINAVTSGRNGDISIVNSGDINTLGLLSNGITAVTAGPYAGISIVNSDNIRARGAFANGIYATTVARNTAVTIESSGSVRAEGPLGIGINAATFRRSSPITINNSADISAGTGLTIDTEGANSFIHNSGLITGFVDLTPSADIFTNLNGAEFNASNTSRFRRGGDDLFINHAGGTVRTASAFNASEDTRFTGLERFENKGLITMVDGRIGDRFTISNTPGGTDTFFEGSGQSTLAVDTFLGGPGSKSDTLVIQGSASGRNCLDLNNVNPGPGQLNREGIPVAFVDGTVKASNPYLDKPIDIGLLKYELFFVPTGSGRFELRSHAGGGAHVLPQIVTASHQTFHNTSETWFDRSTDLRVLLARGSVCEDTAKPAELVRCQELFNLTPGVWARVAGSWLDFDGNATTKANGRTYRYDLGRNLTTWQIESGLDFGTEAVLAPDDILVLGVLGGAVESNLDYNALARSYDLSSLEAGAYATYLRGGFFLDTLFKAFFGTLVFGRGH